MNRASVPGLDALLNRPSAAVLPAPLRQALREHWEAPECDHQMRASWSVLGDTLDALSMLSADEGAVVASFETRRAEIRRQLDAAAAAAGLVPIDDAALLDEVTALVGVLTGVVLLLVWEGVRKLRGKEAVAS